MYYPLKYKSFEELLGTIKVDRVALVDGQGLYLQYGETWGADLSQGSTQTWSVIKDDGAIKLKMAELRAKGKSADTIPLFIWADKAFFQYVFESIEEFADYLIKEGLAVVYNYTPAEDKPEETTEE